MSADFCSIESQSMGEKCRFQEKPEIAPVALKSLTIGHESFLLDIVATVLLSLPDFVYRSCQAIVAHGTSGVGSGGSAARGGSGDSEGGVALIMFCLMTS
jgi:hypothetical protein